VIVFVRSGSSCMKSRSKSGCARSKMGRGCFGCSGCSSGFGASNVRRGLTNDGFVCWQRRDRDAPERMDLRAERRRTINRRFRWYGLHCELERAVFEAVLRILRRLHYDRRRDSKTAKRNIKRLSGFSREYCQL